MTASRATSALFMAASLSIRLAAQILQYYDGEIVTKVTFFFRQPGTDESVPGPFDCRGEDSSAVWALAALRDEGVGVVVDFWPVRGGEGNGYDVDTEGPILDLVGGEEVSGCPD